MSDGVSLVVRLVSATAQEKKKKKKSLGDDQPREAREL